MSNRNLNTVHQILCNTENVVAPKAIERFIESLAIELFDPIKVSPPNFNRFMEEENNSTATIGEIKMDANIECTDDIWFDVEFRATADLLRNETDESDVGMGAVGVIYDYGDVTVVIDKLTFNLLDTQWDLTGLTYLVKLIGKELEY